MNIVRDARQRDGGAVLLVDSGDLFQGTLESNLTEGAAVIRAYNELGYTAAAIGNHEFDFGPVGPHQVVRTPGEDPRGALIARAREARFPLLSANVRRANGGPWSEPNIMASTIVEAAGIRVGMLGVTALRTADATDPRNFAGLEVTPLAEAIVREATQLRAAGATVVLVLAHAGGLCRGFDSPDDLGSCEPGREIFAVAQALPAGLIDVIAGGAYAPGRRAPGERHRRHPGVRRRPGLRTRGPSRRSPEPARSGVANPAAALPLRAGAQRSGAIAGRGSVRSGLVTTGRRSVATSEWHVS